MFFNSFSLLPKKCKCHRKKTENFDSKAVVIEVVPGSMWKLNFNFVATIVIKIPRTRRGFLKAIFISFYFTQIGIMHIFK